MFTLAEKKVYFLNTTDLYEPTAHFNTIAVWVGPLAELFLDARNVGKLLRYKVKHGGAQTSETFDLETLGGRITYKTFLGILGEE
ncbi:hypothetical protein BS47DRAFT_1356888 [Hydnum rufescens UP504]|nr:hypothetical protein BS47DRAFT_1356888 [Hydnum rufescens UP504]